MDAWKHSTLTDPQEAGVKGPVAQSCFAPPSKLRNIIATFAIACLTVSGTSLGAGAQDRFDFYVLALSWSPTFCSGAERHANRGQCGRGLGFIVHGLWPQHDNGYPENCRTDEPDFVPSSLVTSMDDIMPGGSLVGGQWRKHGTCTGLSQRDYFDTVRDAYEKVTIPEAFSDPENRMFISARSVESAFVEANPGMTASGISVRCDSGDFVEVRICMSRDLRFQRCSNVDRKGCRQNRLLVPAAGEGR